jgi:hypothetical protein
LAGCGLLAGKALDTGLGSVKDVDVTPGQIALNIGQQQLFKATSSKVLGSDKEARPKWELLGDVGYIDANGLFMATNPGQGEIRATLKTAGGLGSVVGKAQVFVGPPAQAAPRVLSATVNTNTASPGTLLTFQAQVEGSGGPANIQRVTAQELKTGYVVPFADDGLHYGDAKANDGLFTGQFLIPSGVQTDSLRFGVHAEDFSAPANSSAWSWVTVGIGAAPPN